MDPAAEGVTVMVISFVCPGVSENEPLTDGTMRPSVDATDVIAKSVNPVFQTVTVVSIAKID